MLSHASFLLALSAAAVQAQQNSQNVGNDQTVNFESLENACPSNWGAGQIGTETQVYCCPGAAYQINNSGGCCIGVGTLGPQGCATTVAYDDPNYSSLVSAAADSSSSGMSSPATNTDAMPTGSSGGVVIESSVSNHIVETSMESSSSNMASSSSSEGGAVPTAVPFVVKVLVGVAGGAAALL